MNDVLGIDSKIEARNSVQRVFPTWQRPDDVQQLFFGQADERPTQKRSECECVSWVRQHASDCNEILNLLTPEQTFSCLGSDWNAPPFHRFFIAPQITSRRGQKRDVARAAGAPLTDLSVEDHLAADEMCAQIGNGFSFAVPLLLRRGLAIFIRDRDIEGSHAKSLLPAGMKRVERGVTRLAIRNREHCLETLFNILQNWRTGAEIGGY